MDAKRIRRGTHRLGLALASSVLLIASIVGAIAPFDIVRHDGGGEQYHHDAESWTTIAQWIVGSALTGALLYGLCWLVGGDPPPPRTAPHERDGVRTTTRVVLSKHVHLLSPRLAAMVSCHCGPPDAGETAMRPLKQFGPPVMDALGPMPYCQLNGMLDAAYPKGALNYWKSSFLAQLSDDAIDAMIECFARCPTPLGQLLLEHVHGAVTRVGVGDTAFPHRTDGYNFLVLSEWLEPATTNQCIAWSRETYARMEPFMASGRYVNYLADDEAGEPVAAAYGPNFRRLQELKTRYDPTNFFRMNQNIRPST